MSVVHFVIKRHSTFKEPVKSKVRLTASSAASVVETKTSFTACPLRLYLCDPNGATQRKLTSLPLAIKLTKIKIWLSPSSDASSPVASFDPWRGREAQVKNAEVPGPKHFHHS